MKLNSFDWVKQNIQPILDRLGGNIYGGLVRDFVLGIQFKDVDINYPLAYSDKALDDFITLLNDSLKNKYQYTVVTDSYYGRKENKAQFLAQHQGTGQYKNGRREVKRSKIKIINQEKCDNDFGVLSTEDILEIDLVWNNVAHLDLDVDIHALYLDSAWNVKTYDFPKYRYALHNAKNKQFIALDAYDNEEQGWRIDKLLDKNYTQFQYGTLIGSHGAEYENLTHSVLHKEFMDPIFLTSKHFDSLKEHESDVFIFYQAKARKFTSLPEGEELSCRVISKDEHKALILVPKGTGFPLLDQDLQCSMHYRDQLDRSESLQHDGYFVRNSTIKEHDHGTKNY